MKSKLHVLALQAAARKNEVGSLIKSSSLLWLKKLVTNRNLITAFLWLEPFAGVPGSKQQVSQMATTAGFALMRGTSAMELRS